jgi:hypothetical protein
MEHIENDRLHQFAIEAIGLTEAENIHLDYCDACCGMLVTAVRLAESILKPTAAATGSC